MLYCTIDILSGFCEQFALFAHGGEAAPHILYTLDLHTVTGRPRATKFGAMIEHNQTMISCRAEPIRGDFITQILQHSYFQAQIIWSASKKFGRKIRIGLRKVRHARHRQSID